MAAQSATPLLKVEGLKQRQPAQHAEPTVHAAKLRRDQKFPCPNALFHILCSCFPLFWFCFYLS